MKRLILFYFVIFLIIPFIVQAEDKNIFFLDRQQGEPQVRIKALEESTESNTLSSTALGWLYLLYENNAVKAKEYFEKALVKSPSDPDVLCGLSRVYYWLGEDELFSKNLIDRIRLNPDTPELELLLDTFFGGRRDILTINDKQKYEIIRDLLNKPLNNKLNETMLRKKLLMLTEQLYGVSEDTFKTWKTLGNPDKWQVIGYFEPHNSNCLDVAFPPEKEINLSTRYTVEDWEIKWHKRIATISNYDYFSNTLSEPIENRGNCVYLVTWINSPAERNIALHLDIRYSYKIWLNDSLIARSDRLQNYEPDYQVYSGILQKGSNKLMLKFIGRPDEVQITDIEGSPYSDLIYEVEPPTSTAVAAVQTSSKIRRANRDYFIGLIKNPQTATLKDYLMQTAFYERDGLTQESFGILEELYNRHKTNALINVLMGDAYKNNAFLPREKRQNLALKCYKDAEKLAGDCLPAKFALADYYNDKDKDKAIEYLKKASATSPRCLESYNQLMEIFNQRRWQAEAFEKLKTLEKMLPDNVNILFKLAYYYYQQSNYEKALDYYKRAYDLNGDKYRYSEMNIRSQLGDYQMAIDTYQKMLQIQPDSNYIYNWLINIYGYLKKYESAEPLYHKLISLCEKDSDRYHYYRYLADFYYEWGKTDKAREYWETLNKLPAKYRTYQDSIRRYLDFKDGKKEPRPEEADASVESLIKNAPSEKDYPEAGSIILFEEHVVKVLGDDEQNLRTKETRTHEIVKLLNKSAGEQYGDIYKYGELQLARVFTKDGRILEPDPIQEGGRSLRLPELDSGSVIELKYVKREPFYYRGVDEVTQIDDSPFFRRNKEPIMWFRYVLSVSKSVKHKLPPKYLAYPPKIESDDKVTIYTWEVKNSTDYDKEVYMPDEREVMPWVDIYTGSFSMEKQFSVFNSRYLKQLVPYNVRAKAEELTNEIEEPAEKIRAIYKFVVTEIKESGRSGGPDSDESLSQAIIEKEGSSGALMMAFLKALNIEAFWVLPQTKFRPGSNPDKEGPMIGSSKALIYIPAEAIAAASDIFLAPGQFQPFGTLPTEIQGGNAYVIMPEGIKVVELPSLPFEELCRASYEFNITVAPDGSAHVAGALKLNGEYGASLRTRLKEYSTEQQKEQMMEGTLGRLFKGFKLNSYEITAFNINERTCRLNFDCDVPEFTQKTDRGLEFKPVVKPLGLTELFLRETERKFSLRLYDIANYMHSFDRIRITLPGENITAEVPKSALISTKYGYYTRWVKQNGNDILIERKFSMEEQDIPPEHYQAFANFCKKIEQTEAETIKVKMPKE